MYVFDYSLTGMVTALCLLMYFWTMRRTVQARNKHNVKPPQTTGPEAFERALRVQVNTTEQLVLFLPALWLFALALGSRLGDPAAAVVGLVFLVGRIVYAYGYSVASEKRLAGFLIGFIATVVAVLGAFAVLFYRYFLR